MSNLNFEVAGGSAIRLKTAGKYCDQDIVITATGSAEEAEDLTEVLAEQGEIINELSTALEDSVGGYENGYALGYNDGQNLITENLTDITITKNGEYIPDGENTGFKRVNVKISDDNISNTTDALIEGSLIELNSGATMVRGYAMYGCDIESCTMPNAEAIGNYSFAFCLKLQNINFPEVVTIGT
jgi:hypothetical protein